MYIVCRDVWHEHVGARLPIQAKKALSNKELLKDAVALVNIATQWKNLAQKFCADDRKQLTMKSHLGHLEVHLISVLLDRKSTSTLHLELWRMWKKFWLQRASNKACKLHEEM